MTIDWLLPLLLTLLKSVVLLVALLIYIAYVLYADRKIWAAVQLRRGPNVVGPWGLLQSFADMLKFVLKEPVVPDGANKGVFLLAPFVMGLLSLGGLGGDPDRQGLGDRQSQCRHSLYFRDLVARPSMASSWAAGRRIRNIRSSRRCVRRRRWCLTKSRSAS